MSILHSISLTYSFTVKWNVSHRSQSTPVWEARSIKVNFILMPFPLFIYLSHILIYIYYRLKLSTHKNFSLSVCTIYVTVTFMHRKFCQIDVAAIFLWIRYNEKNRYRQKIPFIILACKHRTFKSNN